MTTTATNLATTNRLQLQRCQKHLYAAMIVHRTTGNARRLAMKSLPLLQRPQKNQVLPTSTPMMLIAYYFLPVCCDDCAPHDQECKKTCYQKPTPTPEAPKEPVCCDDCAYGDVQCQNTCYVKPTPKEHTPEAPKSTWVPPPPPPPPVAPKADVKAPCPCDQCGSADNACKETCIPPPPPPPPSKPVAPVWTPPASPIAPPPQPCNNAQGGCPHAPPAPTSVAPPAPYWTPLPAPPMPPAAPVSVAPPAPACAKPEGCPHGN